MAKLTLTRRLMKLIHPEGIPWPGSVFYNALSSSTIFQRHYELAAQDIVSHCSQGMLLDIGTGPARLLLKLHQQSPGMRLVGIDSSAAMITQAKQNVAEAGLSEFIEVKRGQRRPDTVSRPVLRYCRKHRFDAPLEAARGLSQ
ncbi:MAG: class I SAM-dependent methyltransferase [Planctomycetes bacterium]|nr:class I SAM-dependent methyltransferase [Planctomycetota bacterium]